MPSKKANSSKKKHLMHIFYFLKPKKDGNADELADALINLDSVEEVLLTEGDYGFLVKASFFNGEEPKDATAYIEKRLGRRFSTAVSHYQYTK